MEKFTDNFRVRISDADTRGYFKMPALLGMLQEIAKDHADILGVGAKNLLPLDLGWALSKLAIQVERLPKLGERLNFTTWPSIRTRISTEREFVVETMSGEKIITARSLWVLFDLKKRRLERLERIGDWARLEEFASGYKFEGALPLPSENIVKDAFAVRKDDLDINCHVNNAIYLTWAIEAVPSDFYEARLPKSIELAFVNEVFLGDTPETICECLENETRHLILSEGKERVRANIKWLKA